MRKLTAQIPILSTLQQLLRTRAIRLKILGIRNALSAIIRQVIHRTVIADETLDSFSLFYAWGVSHFHRVNSSATANFCHCPRHQASFSAVITGKEGIKNFVSKCKGKKEKIAKTPSVLRIKIFTLLYIKQIYND